MKQYHSVEDIAELYGQPYRFILRLIAARRLPAINIGSASRPRYLISDDGLAEFERSNSTYTRE